MHSRAIVALALSTALVALPVISSAAEPSTGANLGYGVGSVLASVVYSPAKLTYAGLGILTAGMGFILSGGSADAAANIISPAIRGDYVVTPEHLRGEKPLVFVGHYRLAEPPFTASAPADRSATSR